MQVIEALKSIDYKDVLARAAWTFAQAFIAVFLVAGESIIDLIFNANWNELFTLVAATAVAAVAAGVSAMKTVALEVVRGMKGVEYEDKP